MSKTTVFTTSALMALIAAVPALAQDKKITRDQLPAAVSSAVDKETHGSQVLAYLTEKEHGKMFYEVETTLNGHTRDLQFTADGTLTEVEEEVDMKALAPEVMSGLTAKARGAQIQKVESLTKGGKLVAYEASTMKNGKAGEAQVDPHGKTLAHEE